MQREEGGHVGSGGARCQGGGPSVDESPATVRGRTAGGMHERMKAWEPEEDLMIVQMVARGCRWALIAQELPGRTVASVRNRWQRIEKGRRVREEGVEPMKLCLACKKPRRGHICTAKMGSGSMGVPAADELVVSASSMESPRERALSRDPEVLSPAAQLMALPTSGGGSSCGTSIGVGIFAGSGSSPPVTPVAPNKVADDSAVDAARHAHLISEFPSGASPSLRTNTKFPNTVVGGGGKRDPKRFNAKFRSSLPGALNGAELESCLIFDPGDYIEGLELPELQSTLTAGEGIEWVQGGGTACCGFTKSKPLDGAGKSDVSAKRYANPECGPGEARQGRWRHKDGEIIELHPTPTAVTSKGFASRPSDKATWRMFRLVVRATDPRRYPRAVWVSGAFWIIPDATLAKMNGPLERLLLSPPPLADGASAAEGSRGAAPSSCGASTLIQSKHGLWRGGVGNGGGATVGAMGGVTVVASTPTELILPPASADFRVGATQHGRSSLSAAMEEAHAAQAAGSYERGLDLLCSVSRLEDVVNDDRPSE